MEKFERLGINPNIIRAIKEAGYEVPTPIQEQAIPIVLEGKDVLGTAQTGTGKTAAFAIPLIQRVFEHRKKDEHRQISVLVLSPTRELANQIYESFNVYSRFLNVKNLVVFGGVSKRPQSSNLARGTDVLIATPGRLLDLMHDKDVNLSHVKHLVIDEADQMLDMGFIKDVRKIISKTPSERQTLFFSATMPKDVTDLAKTILREPVRIEVVPTTTTLECIEDVVYFVNQKRKIELLTELIKGKGYNQTLVFVRTKRNVDKIVKSLVSSNIKADAIHSNKSQNARTRALSDFKAGKTEVLVATDIAARGIDIAALPYVYNYDLPELSETYIHRIGRTGRAGLGGKAISFCDIGEKHLLHSIEKLIGRKISVENKHDFLPEEIETETPEYSIAKTNRNRKPRVREANEVESPNKDKNQKYSGDYRSKNRNETGNNSSSFSKNNKTNHADQKKSNNPRPYARRGSDIDLDSRTLTKEEKKAAGDYRHGSQSSYPGSSTKTTVSQRNGEKSKKPEYFEKKKRY